MTYFLVFAGDTELRYATRFLAQHSYRARNLSGGYTTYKAFRTAGLAP